MKLRTLSRSRQALACSAIECSQEKMSPLVCFSTSNCLVYCFAILLMMPFAHAGCREEHRDSCEAICLPNSSHNCTIRAAVILPANPIYEMSLSKILAAVELAERRIKKDQILPIGLDFEWMPYDDKCDASYAAVSAMDAYGKDCAHVIFGPACDYALATVGRITKYFRSEGTPLITVGGFTFDFQKPKTTCLDEFYMLLRVGMLSFRDIGMFTVAVMKKYNWSHALYFYERNGYYSVAGLHTCHLAMNTLAEFFRDADVTYSSFVTDAGTGNLTEDMIREVGVQNGGSVHTYCKIRVPANVLIDTPLDTTRFDTIHKLGARNGSKTYRLGAFGLRQQKRSHLAKRSKASAGI